MNTMSDGKNLDTISKTTPKRRKDEDDIIIQSYLSDLKITDAYQDEFAALIEKIPDLFYPLDSDLSAAIFEQKSKLLSSYGIERPMRPLMDEDGVETPPIYKKRTNIRILLAGILLYDIFNIRKSRQKLIDEVKNFKEELLEISEQPFPVMNIDTCTQELTHIYNFICKLSYCNYHYALFPGSLLIERCGYLLKRVNFTYTGDSLLNNLNERYGAAAKDISVLAEQLSEKNEIKEALLNHISYKQLCQMYPEVVPLFRDFLKQYGFMTGQSYYCVPARSYLENPDRLLDNIRTSILYKAPLEGPDLFRQRLSEMRKKLSPRAYKSLEKKTKYLRYFYSTSSELEYLWETAFFYLRKVLSRIAELTADDCDFTQNIAFLYLDELLIVCQTGVLDDTMKEKIRQRKAKRPFAQKVWLTAKQTILEDPSIE